MNAWSAMLTQAGDLLFGWMLPLPRDLTLLILAGLMVALTLGLRWLTADRDALRQLARDEQRQRTLRAADRFAHDAAGKARQQRIRRDLSARRLQLELRPALASLLPALLIVTWGTQRLEYRPLMPDEEFRLTLELPASYVGEQTHLVAQSQLSVEPTWIQFLKPSTSQPARAVADWTLRTSRKGQWALTLRTPQGSIVVPIEIGTSRYAPTDMQHAANISTHVHLPPYQPLGFVGGVSWLRVPPWLTGLLLLVVPGYLIGRRVGSIP